ncbi:MAG: ABC transporter ATP-binding protein/permease [Candidatus Obscuribacterales bacterium]|nr:ABC transporter ATP-binding protein/permease [Candidatus Obscuribacterales bacterium]
MTPVETPTITESNKGQLDPNNGNAILNRLMSAKHAELYVRLLGYIKPYMTPFVIGLVAAVPSGAMDGIIAFLAGQGLQKIIVEGRHSLVYLVPVGVLVVALLQGLFRFLESYCIRYVGAAAIRDLRNELFEHLESQPLLFFLRQSSGVLIGRMFNDVGIVENAISQTFQTMISRVITLVSLSLVLILQSFWLSIIAISILSLIVLPVSILGKRIRKSSKSGQENVGALVSVLSESIQGARIVQSFNLEEFQADRFRDTNQNFLNNQVKAIRAEAMLSPILAMIGATGIAAVIWVAGYQVLHHHMTLGALTSFIIALLLLYSPIKNIGRINGVLQPALAAAERVFEILDQKSDLNESPTAVPLQPGPHRVEFRKVYYQYPGQTTLVLKDINCAINPGTMVALVGLSGSGKSTLANLVPRFFDPISGTILIDGRPISDYTFHSLRGEIAVVTQDNFLFNTTIAENIAMGRLGASDADIIDAAKAAYCHDFIMELPDGYKTEIGERGVRLSGGQQQRVAIARAILKDAPILILDEATSSLDNESEAIVQEALNNLMKGRTVIVIAHRLSTVRHADEILVLDKGSIIESGSHEELAKRDSTYARLLQAQFERPVLS